MTYRAQAGGEKVRSALGHLMLSTATVLHTHNYANKYSPELLYMYGCDPPMAGDAHEHSKTFIFDGRVILQAHLGNFHLSSAATYQDREDDLAPALFKFIESQLRGFAHGHGKVHSVLSGNKELHDSFDNVVREIAKLEEASGDGHPADDHIMDHLSETTRHATDMPQ